MIICDLNADTEFVYEKTENSIPSTATDHVKKRVTESVGGVRRQSSIEYILEFIYISILRNINQVEIVAGLLKRSWAIVVGRLDRGKRSCAVTALF